jgi:predicted RNA binding protein YcfA (HicA-like mRNA interferase family)
MSKSSKLLDRLLSKPKDLTWDELVKILADFGYEEMKKGKTGGSRRRFVDQDKNVVLLHKPHPANIVKPYVIKQVIEHLQQRKLIEDE